MSGGGGDLALRAVPIGASCPACQRLLATWASAEDVTRMVVARVSVQGAPAPRGAALERLHSGTSSLDR
ncbi:MAG: hypothetical protein ACRDJU_11785 [Actinomycetota bacterium]